MKMTMVNSGFKELSSFYRCDIWAAREELGIYQFLPWLRLHPRFFENILLVNSLLVNRIIMVYMEFGETPL